MLPVGMYYRNFIIIITYCSVIGKSMLFRKSVLRKATGGLAPFGKYLAEDNAIATVIRNAGLSHVLSHKTAVQPLNQASLSDYWKRRSRWTRIRASNTYVFMY